MIATLDGVLEHRGSDCVVLNVAGIGFEVHIPSSTLSTVGSVGERVSLYTHLQLREDNVALYGFSSREELTLFRTIIGVSGIGPKAALALVSALSPEQVASAISNGDVDTISRIPGIGRKLASRLVVELRGRLDREWRAIEAGVPSENADVVAALMSLGYSAKEANRAASSLPAGVGPSLEAKVKAALQQLATE
ncbi:MAG: Holliday junction branch migration protein RuvA [Chloroflexota bacterium]